MTAAIVFALLAQKASPPLSTVPAVAAGATPEFAKAALAVEAKLVAGDVPGAKLALAALPSRTPKIAWVDQATLPAVLRDKLALNLRVAAGSWGRWVKGFAPTEVSADPDLTIAFSPLLPEGPENLPVPTIIEQGPPFRATIGFGRGKPARTITVSELNTEMAYAMGRYLGVGENPFPGTAMYRNASPIGASFWPSGDEAKIARWNLELVDQLKVGVEAGKPIGLVAPSIEMPKPSLSLGEVPQGTVARTAVELTNNGDGPLDVEIKPDCSCFRVPLPGRILPHQKFRLAVLVDTSSYIGQHDKTLLLLSNDPLRPRIQIPVSFFVRPAYRLFHPGGENLVVPVTGGTFDFFLFNSAEAAFHPTSAKLKDIEGKVTISPWTGSLADPELKEGEIPRKGWRVRVELPAALPPGRVEGSLLVKTDSSRYETLNYGFTAQKGIVALGGTAYFPNVVKGAHTSFLINRPNQPFKITGIDAGPFKAVWHDSRGGWEYAIELEYPGGLKVGDFLIPIRIRTDDPKQPLVEALVSGTVK